MTLNNKHLLESILENEMIKIQIYSHYKLPITMEPLKYGKLLDQINNNFIMQLTTKNIAIIKQQEKENYVRIFKNGDLVLEFRDKSVQEKSFIRYLNNTRFLFENDKLISTQILNALGQFSNTPLINNIIGYFKPMIIKNKFRIIKYE